MEGPQSQTQQVSQESPLAKATGKRNFPPAFWDHLSKVFLTPRALRELDRRQDTRPRLPFTPSEVYPTDLARFARRGGPDLKHLQGHPKPNWDICSHYPNSQLERLKMEETTCQHDGAASAYDACFEGHLIDHGIFMEGFSPDDDCLISEPSNVDEIRQKMFAPRASISLSQTPKSQFLNFKRKNNDATSEGIVMSGVIPMIAGDANFLNAQNLYFTNLSSMTENETVRLVPDYFDGAPVRAVHKKVNRALNKTIISTKNHKVPVAVNFFLEVKPPNGSEVVAKRQACVDGATGSRAMQALQSYGEAELIYDNNSYAYSATFKAGSGNLELFAHHATPPTETGGQPKYHMTLLEAFTMRRSHEIYVKGITAFRNLRDLAKHHRDEFIKMANSRASNAEGVTPKQSLDTITEMEDEEVDCREDVGAQEAPDTTDVDDPVSPADNSDEYAATHLQSPDDDQQGQGPASSCKRKRTLRSSEQMDRASKKRNSSKH